MTTTESHAAASRSGSRTHMPQRRGNFMKVRRRAAATAGLAVALTIATVTAAAGTLYSSSYSTLESLPTIGTTYTNRGDIVAMWQNVLYTDYFMALCKSQVPAAAVDGYFGTNTKNATKNWQAANYLTADGIVGPKTWKRMWAKTVFEGYDANYNDYSWRYLGNRLGPGQHYLGFTRQMNSNVYYWTFMNLANPNGGFDTPVQWTGISIYTC